MREFHPTVPDRGTHPPKHSGTFDANRSGQCGLQHLYRVLAFVESGDGINVQIHAKSMADQKFECGLLLESEGISSGASAILTPIRKRISAVI